MRPCQAAHTAGYGQTQEQKDDLDAGLRNLVEAIEGTIRCDQDGCSRKDDLRAIGPS